MAQISVNNLNFYYDGSFDNVFGLIGTPRTKRSMSSCKKTESLIKNTRQTRIPKRNMTISIPGIRIILKRLHSRKQLQIT